ncbi:MAG: glycosyltransferase [Bacteroidales bacterium]|jgi:glycosyltransferase involved in cell wall biosynthesis|nr:glycosyltransferase [Bacteroidales bacterium]
MNTSHQKVLSFCIGTYNRAERVFALVNSILKCPKDDIEVIVTDNNSSDNTIELLDTITDERFKYYRNKSNIGGIANIVRSLIYATGKYAFFCNDRDYIITDNIPKLCEFLYTNGALAFVYCDDSVQQTRIYKDIYTALIHLYIISYHPTGLIFSMEHLLRIENLDWFEKKEHVGHFPFDFLVFRLCQMGGGAY